MMTEKKSGLGKYGNLPAERVLGNGQRIRFDSRKEAMCFDELALRLRAGSIRKLRLQQQFVLKPSYVDGVTGQRQRAIAYVADFVYEQVNPKTGRWEQHIVDCKGGRSGGTRTAEYELKKKLMAAEGWIIEEI